MLLTSPVSARSLTSYLGSVPPVDDVMVHSRVASLGTRSIKKDSKMAALRLILNMIDLTTLEGNDTPGKVKQLCSKAMRPDPTRDDLPTTAAICVYPAMVPVAAKALAGSGVHLAAVATYFPSGQAPTSMRLDDVAQTVKAGADEIDMVIDRGAFMAGNYLKVFEDVVAVKEACGDAHLKVILEVGELGTYDNVRKASMLAMAAGPDFIKTSTGKISPASTREMTLVMLEAIRDYQDMTGVKMGMKPAGGIRTSKDAIKYLVMLQETLGPDWMTNEKFRFGASSLANDVLMQIRWLETGRYQSSDYFTKD